MKFSITIPFYSNETLLRKSVESVLRQSYPNWELIISYSSYISKGFKDYLRAKGDERIVLLKHDDSGISADWNKCIELVTSEYMTLLHADDELEKNYLETVKYLIEKEVNASAYFCDVNIIGEEGNPIFSFQDWIKKIIRPKSQKGIIYLNGDTGLASLLRGCFIFCPTVCYKTEILKKYKYSSKWEMVLDLDLYSRLIMENHLIVGSEIKAYRYRRHSDSYSSTLTDNQKRFREECDLYNQLAELAVHKNWPKTLNAAKNKTIIRLHLYYLFIKKPLAFEWQVARKLMSQLK